MTKYIYARTYLRLMLILAVVVVVVGAAVCCVQLANIASGVHDYRTVKNAPMTINTKNLYDELSFAASVVSSFTSKTNEYDFRSELVKGHISYSTATELNQEQIEAFETYLNTSHEWSRELKARLLDDFQATMGDIKTSVESILNSIGDGTARIKEATTATKDESSQKQSDNSGHGVFSPAALAEMQLDDLNVAVTFLRKGPESDVVTYISPDTAMRTAGDELQAVLEFIQSGRWIIQSHEKGQAPRIPDAEQAAAPTEGTRTKAAILRRFLNQIAFCEQAAKVNVNREWIVDAEISKAENAISKFYSDRQEKLALLRTQMLNSAMLAGGAAVVTAIVALVLLMIRDFLSALIDTAVNTGATTEVLERIRQGSGGEGRPEQ